MRLALLMACSFVLCWAAPAHYDVVVYGGTAAGVIASVSAAREGLKVALLEPTKHLGGMVSGGLGFTDFGKKEVIGGYALEFYYRVGRHYGMSQYSNDVAWYHEPHVAEQVFGQMLKEAGVSVFTRQRLREKGGVLKEARQVRQVTMEDGSAYTAEIFIDCAYEGDLMAQAGVSYTWGREASSQYGEPLAGVRERTPLHQFLVDVPAYGPDKKLLPEISAGKIAAPGSADKLVQAYNYRMCFSNVPGKSVPFAAPAGYDASRYEVLLRLIDARTRAEGHVPSIQSLLSFGPLPNGTFDINNNGAVSTDYIGGSWNYPEADYSEREKISREHRGYIEGLLYTLSANPRVPETIRSDLNRHGLCKEEFSDNGNWPYQLYIREARRMVGEYVAIQRDLQTELTKPDPIGMGSYNSDSHNIQRVADKEGFARNEGDMQVPVKPYQISYRSIVPKRTEVTNLLVPVCFSASHVAYSSMRMEPQYMIMGQASGVAAKMAIAGKSAVQEIDTKALLATLLKSGAIVEYVPSRQSASLGAILKYVK